MSETNSNMNFSPLLSAARSGDAAACDELWEQCRKYLLTIANHDLTAASLQKFGASDVVQQSMLIAHEKLPTFEGSSKAEFLAWMKQIVLFECRQSSRRFQATAKRSIARERSTSEDSQAVRGSLQVADPELTPSTRAASDEQADLVKRALLKLSPQHREVIQLRNWEDFSFEQIGQRMGKSADAVRKLWGRAIEKLEDELKRMNAI